MRFYVSWIQDCGWAAMHCHSVFEAPDLATAKEEWTLRTIDQNHVSVCPVYRNSYEELWKLPEFLENKTKAEIQDFYNPPEICSRKLGNGKCSITEKNNSGGACNKGHLPYGCYQKKREEWEAKWAVHLPLPVVATSYSRRFFSKLTGLFR